MTLYDVLLPTLSEEQPTTRLSSPAPWHIVGPAAPWILAAALAPLRLCCMKSPCGTNRSTCGCPFNHMSIYLPLCRLPDSRNEAYILTFSHTRDTQSHIARRASEEAGKTRQEVIKTLKTPRPGLSRTPSYHLGDMHTLNIIRRKQRAALLAVRIPTAGCRKVSLFSSRPKIMQNIQGVAY